MPTTFRNSVDNVDLNAALGGGTPPASGDTIVLDRFSTNFTANISKPAVDLAAFRALKGWTGNFNSGSPLDIQAELMVIEFGGDYFNLTSDAGAGTIDKLLYNPEKGSAWLNFYSAIATVMWASRGNLLAPDSGRIDTLYANGQARGTLAKRSSGSMTLVDVRGGAAIEIQRDFTAAVVAGGELFVNDPALAAGTVSLQGGTYRVKQAASQGAITAMSGVLDASQLAYDLTLTGNLGEDVLIVEPSGSAVLDYSGMTRLGREPRKVRG